MERWRADWNKYRPPVRGKKKEKEEETDVKVHGAPGLKSTHGLSRLISAYPNHFCPARLSFLVPITSNQRHGTMSMRVHVAGTEISKVSGQCRSIDKTGRGGTRFHSSFFFFFFPHFFARDSVENFPTIYYDENFSLNQFFSLLKIRYFNLGDKME